MKVRVFLSIAILLIGTYFPSVYANSEGQNSTIEIQQEELLSISRYKYTANNQKVNLIDESKLSQDTAEDTLLIILKKLYEGNHSDITKYVDSYDTATGVSVVQDRFFSIEEYLKKEKRKADITVTLLERLESTTTSSRLKRVVIKYNIDGKNDEINKIVSFVQVGEEWRLDIDKSEEFYNSLFDHLNGNCGQGKPVELPNSQTLECLEEE